MEMPKIANDVYLPNTKHKTYVTLRQAVLQNFILSINMS